ncbi:conserved hypothetical protein [Actinacidiphila yanglinensis]|uniref:DUF4139 domain-containing protein n=1 Tax=Actinacidiphila yanglinensis TaxID=310779 RepID=A0A1H5X7M2_9ACTN|nr:DUF4139 domain-containing protein [Actinacidiphila yanglinensis]SEG07722.1 conserved hypothetical protein [Actinacidiphila yanglinensis]
MKSGESGPTTTADGGPAEVPSALTSVVVHAQGAVCTRRARLLLPAGTFGEAAVRVRVGGLPPALYGGSLRGSVVSGPPGLRVADIRVDVAATLRRGEEAPGLRLDLEDAEDRQSRLRDRRDRLAAEIAAVAGFRAEAPQPRRGDAPRWAPVESILALAGFVDARLSALHTRLRAAEDELEKADHDADVLRHRLHQASGAMDVDRVKPSVCAVVTLVSDAVPGAEPEPDPDAGAGSATPDPAPDSGSAPDSEDRPETAPADVELVLELEYHAPGATWSPVYQLRLDGGSGAGTLVLRACVAQRTGEDWAGVRLGLSTADLLRRADLPELRSLRIGRSQQEPSGPGWREPPSGLDELFAGYDTVKEPEPSRGVHRMRVGGAPSPAPPGGAVFQAGPPLQARSAEEPGYGAAPVNRGFAVPVSAPLPAPAAPAPPPPAPGAAQPRSRRATRQPSYSAQATAASDAAAPPHPPAVAPSADQLDYAGLVMTGPLAAEGRGTLRAADDGTAALVTEYRHRAEAVAGLARPAHAVDVRVSAGSFDYRFDTAAPADVEADGQWHTVPVSEVPVRTEFEYVCVPAQDTAVFGTVLVTNTSDHPLLAGPADVVVDGDFVRTAPLPTLAPGQRQAVGLGVAESVQVARRAHMRESTAGLRGGTTVLDHSVEVEVANRLPYPALVEVRERIPTSADKDVRIEEHRGEPRWTDPGEPLDGQDGVYVAGARVWRVTLEPGRTATLTGGFEIRLPVGKSVVGGNRRN